MAFILQVSSGILSEAQLSLLGLGPVSYTHLDVYKRQVLTGIVFQDITKALYTGVAVFVTGKVLDAVVMS